MIQEIKYVNANGTEIVLNRGHYTISKNELRNYDWNYTAYNRPSGYGGRVSFSRGVQEKSISIGIRGGVGGDFSKYAAELLALTEPDILNKTPGRLYIGNQYIVCYMSVSSKVEHYAHRAGWAIKEVSILTVEPFWHEEITHFFIKGKAEMVKDGKRYNGRLPYRYISNMSSSEILNAHYAPSPMRLTIYGAAKNPRIIIGGHEYTINAQIIEGQRIIIDQLKKTIVAKNPDGAETSLFDDRDKVNDVFKFIPPGQNDVIYTGDFDFDIAVILQRSEPSWS